MNDSEQIESENFNTSADHWDWVNRAAAIITVLGFLFSFDLTFSIGFVPEVQPFSKVGMKFIVFFFCECLFAYFFIRNAIIIAVKTEDNVNVTLLWIIVCFLMILSSWQTVSLLFWLFPASSADEKILCSIVPLLINFVIIVLHSGETILDDDELRLRIAWTTAVVFFVSYCFQVYAV